MKTFIRLFFFLSIFTQVSLALRRRLKIQLKEYEVFCLHQHLLGGMNAYTDFYVIKGQERELVFDLQSPSGHSLFSQFVTDGRFQFSTDINGSYSFCFDNSQHSESSPYDKLVNFYLSTNDNYQDPDLESQSDIIYETKSDEMENALEETVKKTFDQLENDIGDIYHLQDSFNNQAMYDMYILELILDRINFWSTLNSTIIIVSCLVQVYFIRSFFNSKKFHYHQNRPTSNIQPYIVPNDLDSTHKFN